MSNLPSQSLAPVHAHKAQGGGGDGVKYVVESALTTIPFVPFSYNLIDTTKKKRNPFVIPKSMIRHTGNPHGFSKLCMR